MEAQISTEWPDGQEHYTLKSIFDQVTLELGSPDVNFRAGSRSFKVHKKMLEKHSSVLKAKLSDVWKTSGDVLQLDEEYVEPEVVEELLTWMYYAHANIYIDPGCFTENAYSLCMAAHYLMIPDLVATCSAKLCDNITPENFHDLYKLSKHLNLDSLCQKCVWFIARTPSFYFSSSQAVKSTAEELKLFIEESLKVENSSKVRDLILLSFPIWVESNEERFQELGNFLTFVPPETLSSECLFRFMETELYSRLDESHRKQYYVRLYLPEGSSSTDKLYCIRETDVKASYKVHCLDLSAEGKWLDFPSEHFPFVPVLGTTFRGKICLLGYKRLNTCGRLIKIFFTKTNEWKLFEPLEDSNQRMIAVLENYIYTTNSPLMNGKNVSRYCMLTEQWEPLPDMLAARLKHRLVALDGLLYAIGGETHGQDSRPERYDSRADRWEYIASTNYHHRPLTTVAHEGQIYVLSQAGFETYSPELDHWIQLPMPEVCYRPSLVSIAGRLWLLTDSIDRSTLNSEAPRSGRSVYEFDVVKQEWVRLPDLPKGSFTDFAFVIKQ